MLSPGQRLQVLVSSFGRKIQCESVVLSLSPWRINVPRRNGVPVPPGESVHLRQVGNDAVYEATCLVLSNEGDSLEISFPQWKRIQRRNTPRFKTDMPCWVEDVQGRLEDLSLEGCSILLPMGIPLERRVRIQIDLSRKGLILLEGTIRRCIPVGSRYQLGIQFRPLSEGLKHKLRWIFLRFNAEWSKESLWNNR